MHRIHRSRLASRLSSRLVAASFALVLVAALASPASAASKTASRSGSIGNSTLGADYNAYAGLVNGSSTYVGAANYLQAHVSIFGERMEALYAGAHAHTYGSYKSSDVSFRVAGIQILSGSNPNRYDYTRTQFGRVGAEFEVFNIAGIVGVKVGCGAGAGYDVDVSLVSAVGSCSVGENMRAFAYMDLSAGLEILWGLGAAYIKAQGWFFDTEFDCLLVASTSNMFGNAWLEIRPIRIRLVLEASAFWGLVKGSITIMDRTWLSRRFTMIQW